MLTETERVQNNKEILLSMLTPYSEVYGIQLPNSNKIRLFCINETQEIEDITNRVSVVLGSKLDKNGWLMTKMWNSCPVSHFVDNLALELGLVHGNKVTLKSKRL